MRERLEHICNQVNKECATQLEVSEIESLDRMPRGSEMVYLLAHGEELVVAGRGERNRAKVIFDGLHTTTVHYKAMKVRILHVYGDRDVPFRRFIIVCPDRTRSTTVERKVHQILGGNNNNSNQAYLDAIFSALGDDEIAKIFMKLALLSSYDGLSDLKKWREKEVIGDIQWNAIRQVLWLD